MSPELLLLHVCAHLACSHLFAFSLRGLCDIAEISRRHPHLDWGLLADQSRACSWERGVAAALRLAAEQLDADIPPQVLERMGAARIPPEIMSQALLHVVSAVDIPQPLRTAPNLVAASSQGPLRSAGAMARRVFLPPSELALLYGFPRRSPLLPFVYVRRLRDLLRRYGVLAWRLRVSSDELKEAARRHARLARWIRES